MIKTVPFEIGHLDLFENGGIEEYSEEALLETYTNPKFEMVTTICDNKVICIGGVMLLKKGVIEVFTMPCAGIEKYQIRFVKEMRRLIQFYIDELKLHRVQATAATDHKKGVRLIKALGFKTEGIMEKFGVDKKNHYMFARLECQQEL